MQVRVAHRREVDARRRAAERVADLAVARAHVVGVVDEERRAEARGELRGGETADGQTLPASAWIIVYLLGVQRREPRRRAAAAPPSRRIA